ncbi:glycosyltransferase family 32 protein [Hydnum rufescens UP504]|uniref:Glycosyltransferase family 32 protein n=1 Tax=Hydnum rufescens UP504 TaxID=1448309 RepID=A0A9P6DZK4_9AGAM|nr:glycosyltransferase family 32 protein [Hydnum rufescens UP504]
MSRLRLDGIPSFNARIPHRVYTTANLPPEKYPEQFQYWAQNDESLEFRHLNDTLMDQYLETMYPSPSPMFPLLSSFPKKVLKADILRYTLMFHKGGIYTDIDTAAVRPFHEWGTRDVMDLTDHVVGSIPLILSGNLRYADEIPPPAVIVSVEMDGRDPEWREKTLARGLQIVQWTIAAQPGHPIFLDAINRALEKWNEAIANNEDLTKIDPLQWTGPGPFTDAVFRYILARHGIGTQSIAGSTVPIRIGDVLILPSHSFQADASEGPQPEQACVWHGFSGSWKDIKKTNND